VRRPRLLLLLALAGATVAGCTSAGGSTSPTWQASPAQVDGGEGGGGGVTPIVPVPQPTGSGSAGRSGTAPAPGGSSSSPGRGKGTDPLVVATHLTAPVGLTLLPDGSALVGERTTGRIVRVQPVAGRPVPTVRTLTGLDPAGDGGLLDLALSPSYSQDDLIYAYITTRTDNRVVDFTLTGPVTPVLTGIPKGRSGNTGRIAFGPDGNLYVGTGDAGRPALAQQPTSLAGKVLRVDPIGDPPGDNPAPGSPVWSSGHRVVDGLCASSTAVFEVEAGPAGGPDEVNRLAAGDDDGYPAPGAGTQPPVRTLPAAYAAPGGCAVQQGRLWVTSLDGTALLAAPLTGAATAPDVGQFVPALAKRYGRLRTVVAAPDGALWLTTSNRDGHGSPVAADERVIRYVGGSSGDSSPA
jgi:glucose/arabinose dehydrogenase